MSPDGDVWLALQGLFPGMSVAPSSRQMTLGLLQRHSRLFLLPQ